MTTLLRCRSCGDLADLPPAWSLCVSCFEAKSQRAEPHPLPARPPEPPSIRFCRCGRITNLVAVGDGWSCAPCLRGAA